MTLQTGRDTMRRREFTVAAIAATALAKAVNVAAQEAVTLGVSLSSDTNPFYIAMRRGIEDRARELGWRTRFVTANEDLVSQNNGVLDLVAQRVTGILISPIDEVATRAAYSAAAKAGIPIMSVARHADTPDQTLFVAMDEAKIGRDIADWVAKAAGGRGQVAMVAGPQGAATFRTLADSFSDEIAQWPGMPVVVRKEAALTREEGLRVAQDILVAQPEVRVIYCGNDELALGAAQAVAQAGRTGQVLVTGLNGVPPALAAVRRGDLALTVELNPATWGRVGVDTMATWLKGERGADRVDVPHLLIDRANLPPAR